MRKEPDCSDSFPILSRENYNPETTHSTTNKIAKSFFFIFFPLFYLLFFKLCFFNHFEKQHVFLKCYLFHSFLTFP